jgi:hypothetical protein
MEEKQNKGSSHEDRPNHDQVMLFCEQHGWTGVTEGICYGAASCKDAAICVLASNFAGRHEKKK